MLSLPAARISWRWWAVWLACFGAFSMMAPRDASFDVAHYHLYNGWAALNGRLDIDAAPADLHSFFNPLYQMLVWLVIEHVPGPVAAFVLSLPQALCLPALYYLCRNLARRIDPQTEVPAVVVLAIAFSGFLAEPMLILFSSVRNDELGALGFILALLLLLPSAQDQPSPARLAGASLLIGGLMGLKLTNLVYVPGFAAAVLIILPGWQARLRGAAICAAAGLAGFFLLAGWWMWQMGTHFGNPFFPLFSGLFPSPDGATESFRDQTFLPGGVLEGLVYPFMFLTDGTKINEHDFFDLRYLTGYCSAIALLVAVCVPGLRARLGARHLRPAIMLAGALLVASLCWVYLFAIERYLMAAWMLGPVMLFALVLAARPALLARKAGTYGSVGMLAALLVTTQPMDVRRVPWSSWQEAYVSVSPRDPARFESALILMAGEYPTAFTATGFPSSAVFTHAASQRWMETTLRAYRARRVEPLISRWDGPIYAVICAMEGRLEEVRMRLAHEEGLATEQCEPLATNLSNAADDWVVCRVRRAGETF